MRRFILIAATLMIVIAVGVSAAPAEIIFWTTHTPPWSDYLQTMVDVFNTSQTEVQATMSIVPGSETDVSKLMTAVRGGTGPDVYMLDRFITAERAAGGLLEDLSPFIKKYDPNMASNYLPFAWAESSFKGKTWSLPFDTDTRGLYYRIDMLQAAGIDTSPLDVKNGPITLAKLKEIAFKFNKTDSSGAYTQIGFIPHANQGWHYTWGFAFGGKFADMKAGKITPTNEGVVAGFQWMYDYYKALGPQKVRTFLSTYAPPNNPPQQDTFITGKVPIVVTGDWNIAMMAEYAPEAKWGVTYIPIPKAGDKPSTWAGGWSFTIPKGSKNADAAFKFCKWMTGPAGQMMYTQLSSHLPTIKILSEDATLFPGEHAFFQKTLSFASSRPALPVGGLYWDALTVAMNDVIDNVATPKVALQKAYDKVQPQLNKFLPLQ
ncbi:MAG: ABC transporter substrate-binding protein [Candidatus Riflebacteria bacterium RBG_13_59_9]|nr:MAG: ABC transporter substrate-binding protein [Candidatus Riflebacteria bacterium RBG_13_59_9]